MRRGSPTEARGDDRTSAVILLGAACAAFAGPLPGIDVQKVDPADRPGGSPTTTSVSKWRQPCSTRPGLLFPSRSVSARPPALPRPRSGKPRTMHRNTATPPIRRTGPSFTSIRMGFRRRRHVMFGSRVGRPIGTTNKVGAPSSDARAAPSCEGAAPAFRPLINPPHLSARPLR